MNENPPMRPAGFSLVEVVLAVGVLSLAVLALLGLFGPMMRILASTEHRFPNGLSEAVRAHVRDPAVQKEGDRWPKEFLAIENTSLGNGRWSILALGFVNSSLPLGTSVRLWRIRLEEAIRPTRGSVGRSLEWRSQYLGSPEPGQTLSEFLRRPVVTAWEQEGFLFVPSS